MLQFRRDGVWIPSHKSDDICKPPIRRYDEQPGIVNEFAPPVIEDGHACRTNKSLDRLRITGQKLNAGRTHGVLATVRCQDRWGVMRWVDGDEGEVILPRPQGMIELTNLFRDERACVAAPRINEAHERCVPALRFEREFAPALIHKGHHRHLLADLQRRNVHIKWIGLCRRRP